MSGTKKQSHNSSLKCPRSISNTLYMKLYLVVKCNINFIKLGRLDRPQCYYFWNEFQNKLPSLDSDFGDISVISNVVWEQRIVSPLIPHNPLLCSTPCCIRGGIYILKEKQFHFHKRKKSLSPEYLQGVQQKKFQISKDSKSNGVSPFPAGCAR